MKSYQHVLLREQNRKGTPYYVVSWRPERGKLRRRTFRDPAKAKEEADYIEKLFSNGCRAVSNIPLKSMIGIAFMLDRIPGIPIYEIIDFYLESNCINGTHPKTVKEAGEAFIESRQDEERFQKRQQKDVRSHIGRFIEHFGDRHISSLKVDELNSYVAKHIGGAPKTRVNHVTTLKAFGRWMRLKKRWLPYTLPTAFEDMDRPKIVRKEKEIFTPEELMRLLVFTPRKMLPFMTIGAFSGIRAAERERLTDAHWQEDNAQFVLSCDITKTQRRRIVPAPPNLQEWIKLAGHKSARSHQYTAKITKAAGVPHKFNALRSSFASYHLQKFKNEALTAMLDGHSVEELNTSYKGLEGVNDRTADEWFSITPQKVVQFAAKNGLPQPEWVTATLIGVGETPM
jgi:integrase